jgi:hypothetical protein
MVLKLVAGGLAEKTEADGSQLPFKISESWPGMIDHLSIPAENPLHVAP